jgi:regulation of enolase protein 1 (concanavalin A-like superfamily)
MKRFFLYLLSIATLSFCNKSDQENTSMMNSDPLETNLLSGLTAENLGAFQWMNPPEEVYFKDSSISIVAGAQTDFFNNPENTDVAANAPFLYLNKAGDFVATALVRPDFKDVWNACALMVHIDSLNWIKFAFENSDATGKSIVSVVTKGTSDDANGVVLTEEKEIWLRIIRKNNLFAMHWSKDGQDFKMARLSTLPDVPEVKVGIEVQCPAGEEARHDLLCFSLEGKTIEDLRKGE